MSDWDFRLRFAFATDGWQIRLLDQTDRSEKLSWATGAVFAVTLTGSAPVRKDMNAENG